MKHIKKLSILVFAFFAIYSCKANVGRSASAQHIITTSSGDTVAFQDLYIAPSSGSDSERQSYEGIDKSFDRDHSSQYHTPWSRSAKFPVILTYNFVNREAIDYIVYYPHTHNGNFGKFELWIQANGAASLEKYGDYDFMESNSVSKISLTGINNPVKIEFRVHSGSNNYVSCMEMEFWKNAPELGFIDDLLKVFTDRSFSELKRNVTDAEIKKLPAFYRNMATKIKDGNYHSEFRVQYYPPYTVPEVWAKTNMTRSYGKLDNCTGIFAEKGEEIIVFVEQHPEASIMLASVRGGSFDMNLYNLRAGANKIKITRSGLLYVMYHTEKQSLPPAKIHIVEGSGTVNGYWDVALHDDADYLRLINLTDKPYFDFKGKYIMLTFHKNSVKNVAPDAIAPIMAIWDSIVYHQFETMGFIKYPRRQNNRIFGISFEGQGYMSATNYRTDYNNRTISWIMDASKMKGANINPDHLWGPCHEIGHVNQFAINWHGMSEASNNLFGSISLHKFGVNNKGGWRATSRQNFDAYFTANGKPHADGTLQNRTSVQYQLYQYFHILGINKDFYPDLFENIRTKPRWGDTPGTLQLNFAIQACIAARLDLTEFFEAWGFFRTIDKNIEDYGNVQFTITQQDIENAKKYISDLGFPKPKHKIQYLLDERDMPNIIKYRNNLQLPDIVHLNRSGEEFIIHGGDNAVAFEVEVDGKIVYVTDRTNFSVSATMLKGDVKVYAVQADNKRKKLSETGISDKTIEKYWHSGKTLPVEMTRQFPWTSLPLRTDNGINVLIDLAHQCTFANLWDMPANLHRMGYRAIGSMASLNTILEKGGKSRIRAYYDNENKIYPFAWWDNPEFNVVITEQTDASTQEYTAQEINAVEQFVANGGGLVIMASHKNADIMNTWSINKLAKRFAIEFSDKTDTYHNTTFARIEGANQKTLLKGDNGETIAGIVKYKDGYVALIGHPSVFKHNNRDSEEKVERTKEFVTQVLQEVSKGKKPVNCSAAFPTNMWGGGAIYPELEQQMGAIVLYYAANQREDLLRCVREYVPVAMQKIEKWLPSKPTDEPMYLILAAGGGGGWAVNAFRPKENGIISLDTLGVLSIFAHELAHTMGGPRNSKGEIAGNPPIPNQGEAHAGWFQGKVDAYFKPALLEKSNRDANKILEKEGALTGLDLSIHYENEEGRKIWGHGTAWHKVWYIWQKLDDRYGTTWYPRWKWIQYNRWADNPNKNLTWDEMIEDMSIAVGEDLFPFFVKLGTTTEKQRLEKIEYNGVQIILPPAPIDLSPAGKVKLDEVGDHTIWLR